MQNVIGFYAILISAQRLGLVKSMHLKRPRQSLMAQTFRFLNQAPIRQYDISIDIVEQPLIMGTKGS